MNKKVIKYLEILDSSFNLSWITTFRDFIRFVLKHHETSKIIQAFHQEKLQDQRQFAEVLSKTIDVLDKYGASNDSYEKVVVECRQFSLDSDQLQNPFFRAEDLFYNLNKELLQLIHQSLCKQKLIGIKNVRILTLNRGVCEATFALPFSDSLKDCELEADWLQGRRQVSLWGKWDRLLELLEWVKDGIQNEEFGQNIKNIFEKFQYRDAIQLVGAHILAELEGETSHKPIKAIEMYLDGSDHYWILVHRVKGEFPEPFHIKRLYEGKALQLLKLLLKANANSKIEYAGKLTHDLGELQIKGELAKVFFPVRGRFAGACVDAIDLESSIDISKIVEELTQLQITRKNQIPLERVLF